MQTNSPTAPDPIETNIIHHVAEVNRSYVELLLDNMIRGINITVIHGNIYAERLCKCAVFVYAPNGSNHHRHHLSNEDEEEENFVFLKKLCRRERAKIFDFSQFIYDLECFRLGQGPRPHFEVILAFGQQLRPGISTDDLLVWCRIASCRAWFQLQRVRPIFTTWCIYFPFPSVAMKSMTILLYSFLWYLWLSNNLPFAYYLACLYARIYSRNMTGITPRVCVYVIEIAIICRILRLVYPYNMINVWARRQKKRTRSSFS